MAWFENDRNLFLLAVVLYGVSTLYAVFLWRRGFRRDDHVNYFVLAAAFGLHTVALFLRGFRLDRCPVGNLYEATIFASWAIVAAYVFFGLLPKLRFLGAFAAPLLLGMGIFALMPPLDSLRGTNPEMTTVWISIHAALLSLAYGAFGLSAVAAIMFLSQERNLKLHKLRAILSLLPPIQRLESVVGRLMIAGFVLLTLGLVFGAYGLSRLQNAEAYRGDPKIIWSALVWLLYLGLLLMRWKFAQRGRRLALGAIGSFAFVLLTFWGTNVLSALHHP